MERRVTYAICESDGIRCRCRITDTDPTKFEGCKRDFERAAKAIEATGAKELLKGLKAALRYIEVENAYVGSMTAAQVEETILARQDISGVAIDANSANCLAEVDLSAIRAAIAQAEVV